MTTNELAGAMWDSPEDPSGTISRLIGPVTRDSHELAAKDCAKNGGYSTELAARALSQIAVKAAEGDYGAVEFWRWCYVAANRLAQWDYANRKAA